ncbi:MAG TPA: hypothetical protein VF403_08340, partial [Kofleriaceae bacterium]
GRSRREPRLDLIDRLSDPRHSVIGAHAHEPEDVVGQIRSVAFEPARQRGTELLHVEAPHEIRRAKVRRHPYLVVYAILPAQLVVLAIAHTSKHPGYWRERIKK